MTYYIPIKSTMPCHPIWNKYSHNDNYPTKNITECQCTEGQSERSQLPCCARLSNFHIAIRAQSHHNWTQTTTPMGVCCVKLEGGVCSYPTCFNTESSQWENDCSLKIQGGGWNRIGTGMGSWHHLWPRHPFVALQPFWAYLFLKNDCILPARSLT